MAVADRVREAMDYVDNWRYEPGVTPLSAFKYQVIAIAGYLVTIHTIQRVMRTRKGLEMRGLLFVHNALLCGASLVLALALTGRLAYRLKTDLTPYGLICAKSIYEDGTMQLIYYINMGFKVWEFIDTFLLALRKKPVPFLHSYHHSATLLLTWVQLNEHSGCQWVPIVINLWVHVFMYYYYSCSALKIRIWWKKYLTSLQISQFVIDVSVVSYAYYVFIKAGFDENTCYGTTRGAVFGLAILFSYLALFIRFYVSTYVKKKPIASRISPKKGGKKNL